MDLGDFYHVGDNEYDRKFDLIMYSRWSTAALANLACVHAWVVIEDSEEDAFDFYDTFEYASDVRPLACEALTMAGYELDDLIDLHNGEAPEGVN